MRRGAGNAASSAAASAGVISTDSASKFSFTRVRVDDFGMATTPGFARSQAIASWAGVQPASRARS